MLGSCGQSLEEVIKGLSKLAKVSDKTVALNQFSALLYQKI